MKVRLGSLFVVLIIALLTDTLVAEELLKLATTTSTYETGLLDYILPPFEKKHNAKIHIISVGTGKAIKLGENGDVDIILVHARAAEDKFVSDGYGVNRRDVMYNDFMIIGPKEDPAGISGLKDAKTAFRQIYDARQTFISRGDDSGTHKKEKFLWRKLGLNPKGSWYLEAGQGMSATLRIADEKNAYVMIDRASYLFNKDKIRLEKLVEGDKDLFNPYGVIAVSPDKHAHVNYELSMALIAWLTSPECQKMIAGYRKRGEQLYFPSAEEAKPANRTGGVNPAAPWESGALRPFGRKLPRRFGAISGLSTGVHKYDDVLRLRLDPCPWRVALLRDRGRRGLRPSMIHFSWFSNT